MRNPFRRRRPGGAGGAALIEAIGRRRGAYTIETPDLGVGHYLFDPSDSCAIHSSRLEAWCDVGDFDVARDELHWHSMMLSERGAEHDRIREIGTQLVQGRERKRIARRAMELEAEMAGVEGDVKSVGARVKAQDEEARRAREREAELREKAGEQERKIEEFRERFNALPRRARVQVQLSIVLGVSLSFTIFDVGVVGSAFHLMPGDLIWKVILTIGVALAPISTAIGIAQWWSAAELPIREGVKATRLAIVAGSLAIIGIGLIVLFRAAATGEGPLPFHAYAFLAFIQSALAMAEAMIYTVYFDGKVGRALLQRIEAAERQLEEIGGNELGEYQRARTAHSRIGELETDAEKKSAKLERASADRSAIQSEEEGASAMLLAIVENAIQEGVQAAELRERREAEAGASVAISDPLVGPRQMAAAGAVALLVYLLATQAFPT